MVLDKTLQSPLNFLEIQPVHPKGNQSWIFTGRTDAEAETPILWQRPRCWLFGKDPHAGKDWRQEEKGTTEDEAVGWHRWLNGHEFEQGSLGCCSPWGCKESDTTEQLNWVNWVIASSRCYHCFSRWEIREETLSPWDTQAQGLLSKLQLEYGSSKKYPEAIFMALRYWRNTNWKRYDRAGEITNGKWAHLKREESVVGKLQASLCCHSHLRLLQSVNVYTKLWAPH